MLSSKIQSTVRNVPDFPKKGINFKDITPLFKDSSLVTEMAEVIASQFKNQDINVVAGIESRGFLLGTMIASILKVPFVPIRKKGKLPYKTISEKYELEYGTAEIEMHIDAVESGDRVLVHDDLLATGGTAAATARLIEKAGGRVEGFSFIISLDFLEGRKVLEQHSNNIQSLTNY